MKTLNIVKVFVIFLSFSISLFAQQSDLNRAKQLINQEQYLDGAKLLRPLAENGDAEACYLAGLLFLEGKGVIKSESQGLRFLNLAAEQNHVEASNSIVKFHLEIKKDTAKAISAAQKYVDNPAVKGSFVGTFLAKQYLSRANYELKIDSVMDIILVNNHESLDKNRIAKEYLLIKSKEFGLNMNIQHLNVIDKIFETKPEYAELILFPFKGLKKEDVMRSLSQNPTGIEAALLAYLFFKGIGIEQNHDLGMKYANIAASDNSSMGKYLVSQFKDKKMLGYRLPYGVIFKINEDGKTALVYSTDKINTTWQQIPNALKKHWRVPTKSEAKELMTYYGINNNMKLGETIDFWTVRRPSDNVYYWQTYYYDGELKKEEAIHGYGSNYNGKLPLIAVASISLNN